MVNNCSQKKLVALGDYVKIFSRAGVKFATAPENNTNLSLTCVYIFLENEGINYFFNSPTHRGKYNCKVVGWSAIIIVCIC